ncbi:MAG TPA: hypothetical protein VGT61_09925 [Thermomicrobiales bacterium]|nr:hypothetical protein [Thermomicrobiales bacterium]
MTQELTNRFLGAIATERERIVSRRTLVATSAMAGAGSRPDGRPRFRASAPRQHPRDRRL